MIDNESLMHDSGVLPPFSNIDHIPVAVTLNTDTSGNQTLLKEIWDFNKIDADKLTQILINVNWEEVLHSDVDIAAQKIT